MKDIKKRFKALLKAGAILLDIRTCREFVGHQIGGARNIPEEEIDRNIDEIRSWQKPVIVFNRYNHCRSNVIQRLNREGIEAYDGGDVEEIESLLREST